MLNFEVIQDIERLIKQIGEEYQQNKGLILTEDDLGSLIFNKLHQYFNSPESMDRSGLKWIMDTQDEDIKASPVHMEVPWYDVNGQLKVRPDITILEPEGLSILHRYRDGFNVERQTIFNRSMPHKQFEFAGNAIIMELKFIRYKSGITKPQLKLIEDDFIKVRDKLINRPDSNLRGRIFCFFVVFNKTDKRCDDFDTFIEEHQQGDWYKYIYCSGKVEFNE